MTGAAYADAKGKEGADQGKGGRWVLGSVQRMKT
jgi:hypothetical protein